MTKESLSEHYRKYPLTVEESFECLEVRQVGVYENGEFPLILHKPDFYEPAINTIATDGELKFIYEGNGRWVCLVYVHRLVKNIEWDSMPLSIVDTPIIRILGNAFIEE